MSATQPALLWALEAVGGFSVRLASSGAEALTLAPSFKPDMILQLAREAGEYQG